MCAYEFQTESYLLQDVGVPEELNLNQSSDVEIVGETGHRRAQCARVTKLLEYFYPPTHLKDEVRNFECLPTLI